MLWLCVIPAHVGPGANELAGIYGKQSETRWKPWILQELALLPSWVLHPWTTVQAQCVGTGLQKRVQPKPALGSFP